MSIKSTKSLLIGALVSAGLALSIYQADAQTATGPVGGEFNNGGSSNYTAPNDSTMGIVRMKSVDGKITGKFATAANRMPGTVIWSNDCSAEQVVTGPYYFTNAGTAGAKDKRFKGMVDVSGTYKPEGAGKRFYDKSSAADSSIFVFSGDVETVAQIIPTENTGNGDGFAVVKLMNKAPKITHDPTAVTNIAKLEHVGGELTNYGQLVLGDGPSTSATKIINNTSSTGNGGITLNGVLTVNDFENTEGKFTIPDDKTFNVNDKFTYTAGLMDFACKSNFNYTGTNDNQVITAVKGDSVAKTGFYAYGNLGIEGKNKVAGGDFNVCNNFHAKVNLDMAPGKKDNEVGYTMTMLNETDGNHATYEDDIVEVTGNMKYLKIGTTHAYTFNNKNTEIKFDQATDLSFGLYIRGNAQPNMVKGFNEESDIRRIIQNSYVGSGRIESFKTMWKDSDEGTTFDKAKVKEKMHLAEGYDKDKERKKLIRTGGQNTIDDGARTIVYATPSTFASPKDGINLDASKTTVPDPVKVAENRTMYAGRQIMLTTAPQTKEAVQSGRWSDPLTWDDSQEPSYDDIVTIAAGQDGKGIKVWVGDTRQLFDGTRAWEPAEKAFEKGTTAASRITIGNVEGAGLYIGNQDSKILGFTNDKIVNSTIPGLTSKKEAIFTTELTINSVGTQGIFNLNTNTGDQVSPGTDAAQGTKFNGLWIAKPDQYVPVLGAPRLENVGNMLNNGVTEIGVTCAP